MAQGTGWGFVCAGTSAPPSAVHNVVNSIRHRAVLPEEVAVAAVCRTAVDMEVHMQETRGCLLLCSSVVLGERSVGNSADVAALVSDVLQTLPHTPDRRHFASELRRHLTHISSSSHSLSAFFSSCPKNFTATQYPKQRAPLLHTVAPSPIIIFLRRLAVQWQAATFREQSLLWTSINTAPFCSSLLQELQAYVDNIPQDEEEEEEEEEESEEDSLPDLPDILNEGASCVDIALKAKRSGCVSVLQEAPAAHEAQHISDSLRRGLCSATSFDASKTNLLSERDSFLRFLHLSETGHRPAAVECCLDVFNAFMAANPEVLSHTTAPQKLQQQPPAGNATRQPHTDILGAPAGVGLRFIDAVDAAWNGSPSEQDHKTAPDPGSKVPIKSLCGMVLLHLAYLHCKFSDAAAAKLCVDEAIKAGLNLGNPALIAAACYLNVVLSLKSAATIRTIATKPQTGFANIPGVDAEQSNTAHPHKGSHPVREAVDELLYGLRVAGGAAPAVHAQLYLALAFLSFHAPVFVSTRQEDLADFLPGLRRDVYCMQHHSSGQNVSSTADGAVGIPSYAAYYHKSHRQGSSIGGVIGATLAGDAPNSIAGAAAANAATAAQNFFAQYNEGGQQGEDIQALLCSPRAGWAWGGMGGEGLPSPHAASVLSALREALLHTASSNAAATACTRVSEQFSTSGQNGYSPLTHTSRWAHATATLLKAQLYEAIGLHDLSLAYLNEMVAGSEVALVRMNEDGFVRRGMPLEERNARLQRVLHLLFVRMDVMGAVAEVLLVHQETDRPERQPIVQQALACVYAVYLADFCDNPAAAAAILTHFAEVDKQWFATPDMPVVFAPWMQWLHIKCLLHPALCDREHALRECLSCIDEAVRLSLTAWTTTFELLAVEIHLLCASDGMMGCYLMNALRGASAVDLAPSRAEALLLSCEHHLALHDLAKAHSALTEVNQRHLLHLRADARFKLRVLSAQLALRRADDSFNGGAFFGHTPTTTTPPTTATTEDTEEDFLADATWLSEGRVEEGVAVYDSGGRVVEARCGDTLLQVALAHLNAAERGWVGAAPMPARMRFQLYDVQAEVCRYALSTASVLQCASDSACEDAARAALACHEEYSTPRAAEAIATTESISTALRTLCLG